MSTITDRPRRGKRRKPLAEIDREHVERIDRLKREINNSPDDEFAAARLQAAIDQWHAWRRQVSDDYLFAARVAMENDSLILSNILDARYPTAQERELIVDLSRLRRDLESVAKALAAMEARLSR